MLQLNRTISYTKSWKSTFIIAFLLGISFSGILVLLQPFDTYNVEMEYKHLKLFGYLFPMLIAISSLHFLENFWYDRQKSWKLINEIVIICIGFFWISILSFYYLNYVVNPEVLSWSEFIPWMKNYGLPFSPIILSFWIYLRYRLSKISVSIDKVDKNTMLKIHGKNNNETHVFEWQNFYYGQAQSNYVDLFVKEAEGFHKIVLRSSFANLIDQLPQAIQVHRSYVINLNHLKELGGNSRQGYCMLEGIDNPIPVSPKHFKALKMMLQNRT